MKSPLAEFGPGPVPNPKAEPAALARVGYNMCIASSEAGLALPSAHRAAVYGRPATPI